jgi:hypothetical protein
LASTSASFINVEEGDENNDGNGDDVGNEEDGGWDDVDFREGGERGLEREGDVRR